MLRVYSELLRTPGAARLVSPSLLGRLHHGALSLPLLLLAEEATGSYAGAGAASAAFGAGIAAFAPMRGRAIDRWGSRRVLPPLLLVSSSSLAILTVAGSAWSAIPACAVSGATVPSLPAAMRLEWQRLLAKERMQAAYAFETVAQVGVFIVGPLLAAAGVALAGAATTLLVSIAVGLAGGLLFARRAQVHGTGEPAPSARPIRIAKVRALVLAVLLADIALGVVEVTVVAFADRRGEEAAGGLLLAAFTGSAVVGGALYGARQWQRAASIRLPLIMGLSAVAFVPLVFVDSLLVLGALLVLAGAPSAAQWATASSALDEVAPEGAAGAEAYNWLSTANSVGVAAGSVVSGAIVEAAGPRWAFAAAAMALVAGAAAATRLRT